MKIPKKISPLVKESVKDDAQTRQIPMKTIFLFIFGTGLVLMVLAYLYAYMKE